MPKEHEASSTFFQISSAIKAWRTERQAAHEAGEDHEPFDAGIIGGFYKEGWETEIVLFEPPAYYNATVDFEDPKLKD